MTAETVFVSVFPIQPFFVLCASRYYKMTMSGSPVAHFYSFTADSGIDQVIAVPDGCFDLIFACGSSNAKALLYGTVTVNTRIPIISGLSYFGVRYHPGVVPWGIGVIGSELVDHSYLISDDPGWNRLTRQIAEEEAFVKRVALFTSFAGKVYESRSDSTLSRLAFAAQGIILARRGAVQMRELEDETGYSARYINKAFTRQVGVNPKAYCKFIRFQTLLSQINRRGGQTLTDFSLDAGYYDHSHMLRDFKAFTSFSPRQYTNIINPPVYKNKIIDLARSCTASA